jgi:hypothetical protein
LNHDPSQTVGGFLGQDHFPSISEQNARCRQ